MMRKQHAEHNEALCDHLIGVTGYNDWVVTTAFYAGIHYVEHKLFPLSISPEKTYQTFEALYAEKKRNGVDVSKHKLKIQLVHTHLRQVWSRYKRLHDACRTARYTNYVVSDTVAQQAKKDLDAVKAECSKR